MGIALVLALESRHTSRFDRDRAVALASKGTIEGFFPGVEPARRPSRPP